VGGGRVHAGTLAGGGVSGTCKSSSLKIGCVHENLR